MIIFASEGSTQIIFTDITSSAGVAGIGDGGHGIGVGDVNGDNLLDMYITNSYNADVLINHFYINQGNNVFQDRSVALGVDDSEHIGGHAAILIDIDNDQDLDIFIGNMGPDNDNPHRNTLFRNNGALSFTDVSVSAGIGSELTPTRGVAGMDVDSDGDLDLLSSPFYSFSTLYINDGNGFYSAEIRGVEDDTLAKQGISTVDIEGDGDMDLYVNKWGQSPNRLFVNDGIGYFSEMANSFGIDTDEFHNNGAAFADMDNDGDQDLFVLTRTGTNPNLQVFRNNNGSFADETAIHGILGDGFSPALGDVDNDGDLDLFVPRSYLDYALYLNDGNGYFTERIGSGVEANGDDARSASFADFDNDGDLDLMVVQKRGFDHLFRNETNNSRFIEIRLISPAGEKYGMGTRASLYSAGHGGDDNYLEGCRGTVSSMAYLSQVSPVIHFGLTESVDKDILLTFQTGEEILLRDISPGVILDVDARNQSPQDFQLLTPSLGDTVTEMAVNLDWEDSFDPNPWDSVLYDLHYGPSQVFEPSSTFFEGGLTASEYTIITELFFDAAGRSSAKLLPCELYDDVEIHWKVLTYDTRNDTIFSTPEQSSFWLSKPQAPGHLHLAVPVNRDSISAGEETLFIWTRSIDPDPYDSLLTYIITTGLDTEFSETLWTESTYGDTVFTAEPFDEAMTFYWNVVAVGEDGLSTNSSSIFECYVIETSGIRGTDDAASNIPGVVTLSQNYPNPFNPSTKIRIEIPAHEEDVQGKTSLRIFSLRGRLVVTLFDGYLESGTHDFIWDGLDNRQSEMPSGVYITVMDHDGESRKMKMLLNK